MELVWGLLLGLLLGWQWMGQVLEHTTKHWDHNRHPLSHMEYHYSQG